MPAIQPATVRALIESLSYPLIHYIPQRRPSVLCMACLRRLRVTQLVDCDRLPLGVWIYLERRTPETSTARWYR